MRSTIRREARTAALDAAMDGRRLGLDGRELARHVDAAYPFATRSTWRVRVWHQERRAVAGFVRRPRRGAEWVGVLAFGGGDL